MNIIKKENLLKQENINSKKKYKGVNMSNIENNIDLIETKSLDCKKGVSNDCTELLFFFLLLVCILGHYECDVGKDTLLFFFLILVILMNEYDF